MRRLCLAIVTISVLALPVLALGQLPQPQFIIDKPTAGMLPDRSYMVNGRAGAQSSFLFAGMVGFKEVIQIGLSYGAQNVFDQGSPVINDYPGVQLRIRFLGETERRPAFALGFNSQGWGIYHGTAERYDRKSTGLYGVVSKNFALLVGEFSLHGGMNWSTEKKDDNDPNVFAGSEWVFFQHLSLLFEFDAAFNDNEAASFGNGGVYLDAGVGWYFGEFANVTLAFRDLTRNFAPAPGVSREIRFQWIQPF